MSQAALLPLDVAHTDPAGFSVLALSRVLTSPKPRALSPKEQAIIDEMPWPHRRSEWLAGRAAAKSLLEAAWGFAPETVEILPLESGAPRLWISGQERTDLHLNISHTHGYAVAACAKEPVGIDVCDDDDGRRLPRIARRVMSEGEAEACGAFESVQSQAAVWAVKEAGLKLRIGGVFQPGARSVRIESLAPPRVADPSMRLFLFRLPEAALAVALNAA
jgi:phosphopantetheinyl transferase